MGKRTVTRSHYGTVDIQCPGCEYDWSENADHVFGTVVGNCSESEKTDLAPHLRWALRIIRLNPEAPGLPGLSAASDALLEATDKHTDQLVKSLGVEEAKLDDPRDGEPAPGKALDPPEERHPKQPIITDAQGVRRFKANAIVRWLVDLLPPKGTDLRDGGLNRLARIAAGWEASDLEITPEDREQLAMLIGYSVSGAGDLDYMSPERLDEAEGTVLVTSTDGKPPGESTERPWVASPRAGIPQWSKTDEQRGPGVTDAPRAGAGQGQGGQRESVREHPVMSLERTDEELREVALPGRFVEDMRRDLEAQEDEQVMEQVMEAVVRVVEERDVLLKAAEAHGEEKESCRVSEAHAENRARRAEELQRYRATSHHSDLLVAQAKTRRLVAIVRQSEDPDLLRAMDALWGPDGRDPPAGGQE